MRLGKVRGGELLALAGAVLVLVSLLLRWYETPSGSLDAWDTFGAGVVLVVAAAAAALVLFVSALLERGPAVPVAAGVWTIPLGITGVVAAIVRVLERPDHAGGLCAGSWLALAGTLAILAGALGSVRNERRSLYPPAEPQARPRP